MATTFLSFGTNDTLLGLDVSSTGAPLAGTRADKLVFPTVSYSGGGFSAGATVQLSIAKFTSGSANPTAVLYVQSTGLTYALGSTVTFAAATSADLVTFLQGVYVRDYTLGGASEDFQVRMVLSGEGGPPKIFSEYYTIPSICYLRGTGIATDHGDVAVEDLRIGDMVRTLDGSLKPVKFVGTQSFEAEFVAAAPSQRPVLIRKDAIAPGQPARDLYVSAMHSLYIDDVLVPAAALVNGSSIVRADIDGAVDYFHVELDGHEVIFAEGLPAESFIDDQSRAVFDNAFEYEALYGEGEAMRPFAQRIEEGYTVDAIRRRIAGLAGVEFATTVPASVAGHVERIEDGALKGWVMDQANGDVPVELEILVDGETVGQTLANRYRTDLDHAGLAGGRCGFSMALPASVTSLDQVQVRVVATGVELHKSNLATAAV